VRGMPGEEFKRFPLKPNAFVIRRAHCVLRMTAQVIPRIWITETASF
jgi:hypothetical protein